MTITQIKGNQILDGTIKSSDIDDSLEKDFTKVRVTTSDSSPDFLSSKIAAGNGISITVTGASGSAQTMTIASTGGGGGGSSAITSITAGTGLAGGGSTGVVTLYLSNTGSAGQYGSTTQVPVFNTDEQGRVTAVTNTSIQIPESQVSNLISDLSGKTSTATMISAGTGLTGGGDLSTNRTLSINDSVVATISGSTFTGVVKFNQGLSGSLTQLSNGTPYLLAGNNIVLSTGSNGAVTIASSGGNSTISSITAGVGLLGGGSSGNVSLSVNNSVVATISGSTFTGAVSASGLTSTAGLTQSGGNVSIVGQTDGTVTVGNQNGATSLNLYGGSGAINLESTTGAIYIGNSAYARAVQLGTGNALQNVFIGSQTGNSSTTIQAGNGGMVLSGSAGTNYTIGSSLGTGIITLGQSTASNTINVGNAGNNATNIQTINIGAGSGRSAITIGNTTTNTSLNLYAGSLGLSISGSTRFNQGLSGSLTKLTDGSSYLIAGNNVTLMTGTNGAVTISTPTAAAAGAGSSTGLGDLILVESKYVTTPVQTLTFSNLDGQTHKIYKMFIKRGNIAAITNYEIRPNGLTTNMSATQHVYGGSYHQVVGFTKWALGDSFATSSSVMYNCTIMATTGSYRFYQAAVAYDNGGTLIGANYAGKWTDVTVNITSIDLYSSTTTGWPTGTEAHLYRKRVG